MAASSWHREIAAACVQRMHIEQATVEYQHEKELVISLTDTIVDPSA